MVAKKIYAIPIIKLCVAVAALLSFDTETAMRSTMQRLVDSMHRQM